MSKDSNHKEPFLFKGARMSSSTQSVDMASILPKKDTFDLDNVNLCKGCGAMKHLNSDGLCGRCKDTTSSLRLEVTEIIYGVGTTPIDTNLPDVEAIIKALERHIEACKPEKDTRSYALLGFDKGMQVGWNVGIAAYHDNIMRGRK